MTTTQTSAPTPTAAAFRRKIETMFRRGNPGADIVIEWTFTSRPSECKGAPGEWFRSGLFTATAPGYAPRHIGCSVVTDRGAMNWMVG